VKLHHLESTHQFEVDDKTGLLTGLSYTSPSGARGVGFETSLNIQSGGGERRAATGGLEYFDCKNQSEVLSKGKPVYRQGLNGISWHQPISIGTINAELIYRLDRQSAAAAIAIYFPGGQEVLIRDVNLVFQIKLPTDSWLVNMPGNGLRKDLPISILNTEVGISPVGGLRGSSSVVHLGSKNNGQIAIWPNNRVEIPQLTLKNNGENQIQLRIDTNFGSDLSQLSGVELEICKIDLSVPAYQEFAPVFQDWLRKDGYVSPNNPPKWIDGAMIYEAQIGFSVFNEVNHYSPYPQVRDLINDLDQIAEYGFTCIQLMPKQPYPSYNIHDFWDIDTSYGNKDEIKELVQKAHKLGIKVILDILLHGVLDKEIIKVAADGVRSGPFAELISSDTGDSFNSDVKDWHNYLIAWSRHILDFEKYWYEGSPAVSPLIAQHPDWFFTDSNGQVQGVYTKAFDARNSEWQDYFISACEFLMNELNIDGFRFDAPSYNDFPNWATWARGRAGASALGCLGLFDRLRPVMKKINPQSLLYTEPSGHVFRQAMDLNYNYDEQWLVTSLADEKAQSTWGIRCAKDLASWVEERDKFLPNGSMTAHHIDSHDTFWWPSWGKKWRREQFDITKVKLLTLIFGSLPGPFMMFSGGEIGIEQLLPKLAAVKRSKIWLMGEINWWTASTHPDGLFAISRKFDGKVSTSFVNFTDKELILKNDENLQLKSLSLQIGEAITIDSSVIKLPPFTGAVVEFEVG
jgi:glycosidase